MSETTEMYLADPKVDLTKVYIGIKVIRAVPISKLGFLTQQDPNSDHQEAVGQDGYKVIYEDGYVSWSPKEVFETCYRELTTQEKEMIY